MIRAYEDYARDQHQQHMPVTKQPADFLPADSCPVEQSCADRCDSGYRRCFTACGGEVTEQR